MKDAAVTFSLLGLERDLGCLRPGMPATFVAVKGSPGGLPDSLFEPVQVTVRGKSCAGSGLDRMVIKG